MKKKVLFLICLMFLNFGFAFGNSEITIDNKKIVFNSDEFKFYQDNKLLSKDEVQELFKDYEVILISDFDKNKKLTIKKSFFKPKKVLLLNDTNRTFHNFFIYPETSRSEYNEKERKDINALITIYVKKDVRLRHFGGDEFKIIVK